MIRYNPEIGQYDVKGFWKIVGNTCLLVVRTLLCEGGAADLLCVQTVWWSLRSILSRRERSFYRL